MPKFTYAGDDGRYYPDLGVVVNNGDVVDLPDDPGDGRFTPAPTTKAKATAAATSDPAPEA